MIRRSEIRKIITVITAVLCIVVFTVLLFYARDPSLFSGQGAGGKVNYEDDFIKFMDVGQGDGAIIYSNGYCAVIDMGEAVAAKDVLADLNRLNVKQIDMLIVVNQMLTGFDSKWINVLYLDKLMRQENIIQAFSRTNRIYGSDKPVGLIYYYRYPYTMKRNIEEAVKMYSGDKEYMVFVDKLEKNLKKFMNQG